MLAAIVLVAVHSGPDYVPYEQVAPPENQQPYQAGDDADFHVWGDSWAQWLMMAFSAIAAAVSLGALHLLARTFDATEKTAKAAIEANEIARLSNERQLRAYVQGKLATIETANSIDGLRLRMVVRNDGQTPARAVTAKLSIWLLSSPIRPEREAEILSDILHDETVGGDRGDEAMMIGPQTEVALYLGIDPDNEGFKEDIEAVLDGESLVVLGGRIHYRDVFGNPRVTTIFHTIAYRDGDWEAGYHTVGNDAD